MSVYVTHRALQGIYILGILVPHYLIFYMQSILMGSLLFVQKIRIRIGMLLVEKKVNWNFLSCLESNGMKVLTLEESLDHIDKQSDYLCIKSMLRNYCNVI